MPLKPYTLTLPSEIIEEIDRRNGDSKTRSASLQSALYKLVSSESTFDSLFPKQESSYKQYYEQNIKPKLEELAKEAIELKPSTSIVTTSESVT